ncbi:hypothetical protein [Rhizobium skierniewicense]|uniref:hypothetical protein n=1 Tax=Rhizobium skierniewicense TaxID=984260 RepID=UPI0015749749|nr:hypothetical protein [Rhizobium skierniewicense]NTF34275.1 hypothetical protein [Rhizobium skierniewicense]
MSAYEAITISGKTVFVPKEQAAQPVPPKAPAKGKPPYSKRVGKKYGERKHWW